MVSRRLVLIILCLLTCLSQYSNRVYAADSEPSIKMSIEAEEAYLGDTVLIVIEAIGLIDPLDLSILSVNARFERETTGTRIKVHKGRVVEVKLRRMEFTPLTTGTLIFGPVTSGDISSNSVSLKVLDKIRMDWVPDQNDVSIDIAIDKTTPYLYSQLVLDINLIHRYPITDEQIRLPELNGFLLRTVYEKRRTFTSDSQEWRQISWRYLLFPERSGELTIGPVSWTGTIIKSRPERAAFHRVSDAITLKVLPAQSESGQWWLPASQLSLSESWSSKPTELKAGDELTRTLTISANDILAAQIPTPVIQPSRALNQTLISSQRHEELSASAVQATAEFVYRVKAQSPVPVFLDTVRISWWNTQSDTQSEAIIPARRINVGLPDRADILKNSAISETGVSAFEQWWAQAGLFRTIVYCFALIALITLLITQSGAATTKLLNRYRIYNRRKEILKLVTEEDWARLIKLLKIYSSPPYRNKPIAVLPLLEQRLYGNCDASLPTSKEIDKAIYSLDLNPEHRVDSSDRLAVL